MRDYLAIVRRNLLSPIVLAIFLLAGALVYVNEHRDAWFISVVITVNSLIGIVQELRVKYALRKLELLAAPRARVVQGDSVIEVAHDELAVGQEIELVAGDEVPADAKITKSKDIELQEGMLTGESLAVTKHPGDMVYAATTVLAGSARALVVAVGENTRAGVMGQLLKRYKPELTPLQRSIQLAIAGLAIGAVCMAVLIFIVYRAAGEDAVTILKTIVSASVAMVPEGLLLASSLLLAFGSVRLAQAKVLPQKLSAIEAMALLNILAVDKTGTLTSDKIILEGIEPVGSESAESMGGLAAIVAHEASGSNATGEAVLKKYTPPHYELREIMAFSSARKMSGVRVKIDGRVKTIVLGAPEYIDGLVRVDELAGRRVDELSSQGQRVLLLVKINDNKTPLKELSLAKGEVLGLLVLSNPLRKGVKNTVKFLQNAGVGIRVISGDNPQTVQYVAQRAGIDGFNKAITGAALLNMSDDEFAKAADDHVVFARVLPEQKERLVQHFKKQKLFTGMVGDGVNDALALKEADLGVAMYAGAAASRRVSDIVLLNNSFTSLPMGMKLGNQIMQAIELIATLFFHKIVYGLVLLISTLALGMAYPFQPRHITFMNIFLVTLSTIMWTFFPPRPKHRVNPSRFWYDTLLAIMPIAVITGLTVAFTYWITSLVYEERPLHVATVTVLTATFFGVYMVFLVARMLGVTLDRRARIARLLYLVAVIFIAIMSFGTEFTRDFFDFSKPTVWILWPAIAVIALAATMQWHLAKGRAKRFDELHGKLWQR